MQKIFCLLIGFFCFINGLNAQDKKAQFYLMQGEKEFKQGKYAQSLAYFDKYFAIDSSDSQAFLRSAQIQEIFRNSTKAMELYEKMILLDEEEIHSTIPYTYTATRYLDEGRFEKAKINLLIALENTNKNARVYQQMQNQLKRAEFGLESIKNPLKINTIKLPEVINAHQYQYFPSITADGKTLIFTVVTENGDEDLYISQMIEDKWETPKSISKNINTPENEGAAGISADGKIMVFTSCKGRKSYGSCDLFISYKEGDIWSEPKNMGSNVNSPYWDSQPSLSPDGSRIFFSSDRPYGVGKKDIWMSELDDEGKWKKAVNLGPKINTPADEVSPFVHANGATLFYSSNGKEGLGNQDIFMTDISNGFMSESINLGYPINTTADETGLFVSADGSSGYYSLQKDNQTDIYQFEIPLQLSEQFNKIFYLKGYILDSKTQEPLYSSIEVLEKNTGKKISKFYSDSITGDYMSVVPGKGDYIMYIETPGYFFKSLEFQYEGDEAGQELDIELKKIEKQSKETLNNIFFDTGSAELRKESETELIKLLKFLQENPELSVEISGHTDNTGNEKLNQELSMRRAESVIKYLRSKGIAPGRLTGVGYGQTQPIASNDSETNRQLNRRIELRIL